jgi:hypothetical protein
MARDDDEVVAGAPRRRHDHSVVLEPFARSANRLTGSMVRAREVIVAQAEFAQQLHFGQIDDFPQSKAKLIDRALRDWSQRLN